MKQRYLWLLALLSVLTLMTTTTLALAEEAMTRGHVEIGISGMDTDDNPARVNEYVNTRSEEGFSFAPKVSLETISGNSTFGFEADIAGPRDQDFSLEFDAKRIFKFNFDYQVLEHWKDHETLGQMGATLAGDLGGGQPSVTTDKIFADTGAATIGGSAPINGYDPQVAYTQELNNDYIVTRREFENEIELALPALPNVTFHAGMRIETRKGMEQAIGLSKCSSCHVSAEGKDIDERTEDFTFGATGKFGPVTVEYEYLTRDFTEDATAPGRYYATVGNAGQNSRLLYDGSELEYAKTPDSEKDTHTLRIRADFANNTSVTGSYVKSNVESSKNDVTDASYTLEHATLKTELESFGAKATTKFGDNWRFSVRASTYEIEADSNELHFADRAAFIAANPASEAITSEYDEWVSAEEREVTEFGIDAVYRLAKATTLRLGYEYENIEREEAELGETETHSFKASIKSRLNSNLSGRLSYLYQDIDDPFGGDDATGIYQGTGTADPLGSGLYYAIIPAGSQYWDDVYPERTMDATNRPDTVHEVKLNATWTPSANTAATFFTRVRYEENDSVEYQQTTYVPGVSFWYAPNNKVNLTMAYTFTKQDTENRACVGWYHG
ncbi:MAG: MtrB/PioB family outer membrane beta-barrel protein [Desulfuromusa sp.]|nr:MtrB/PioB family outer membrane beta-barrel protein [Desulfuromusa sp.]